MSNQTQNIPIHLFIYITALQTRSWCSKEDFCRTAYLYFTVFRQPYELWIPALSFRLSVGSANVTFLLTSSVHFCPRSLRAALHNSKDIRVLPLPTANFPDIIKASLLHLSLPLHTVTPSEVWCPRNVWNGAMISPKWFQSVTSHCLWVSWSDWCRHYGVSGELHELVCPGKRWHELFVRIVVLNAIFVRHLHRWKQV